MNDVLRERPSSPLRLQWAYKLKLWRILEETCFCWHRERLDKEDLFVGVKHILSQVI
jgi:hypothetical protein